MENNQEENSGGGGKKAIEKIAGGGMKTTILKLVMAYNALTYFLIIFFGIVVIFSVFPDSAPASEKDSTPVLGEKEGSIGYAFDFISEKAGRTFDVTSGCDSPRGSGRVHDGYDLSSPVGTPIYAIYPGEVTYIKDWYRDDGIQPGGDSVRIKKDNPDKDGGLYYQYTHIVPNPALKEGQRVEQGILVGTIKPLGGPHVDIKKSNLPDVPVNARICNGGTVRGLPTNKYEAW